MNFIKKHSAGIIASFCIIILLGVAFFAQESRGGDKNSDLANKKESFIEVETEIESVLKEEKEEAKLPEQEKIEENQNIIKKEVVEESKQQQEKVTTAENDKTDAEEDTKNVEVEEKEEESKPIEKSELTCTLSVQCDNAVGKSGDKTMILPQDGIIFKEQSVVFYEGESVFNILTREMKKNNIHMEFVNVPMYNSAYIEGIGNLYEFDCGELSGWMYKVNGYFPNYGCSNYKLKDGDKVEIVYTCDLGADVGGSYSARNGR